MQCHKCGVEQKNMINVYDQAGEKVLYQLCPDCAQEEVIVCSIVEWKEAATCPSCRGKLRQQGDTDTSVLELGRMLHYLVTNFNPVTFAARSAVGLGKAIFSEIKGEEMSILRQCSKCDAYVTKCPKCSKTFIPGSTPKFLDGVSTTCPKCGQKIKAFT